MFSSLLFFSCLCLALAELDIKNTLTGSLNISVFILALAHCFVELKNIYAKLHLQERKTTYKLLKQMLFNASPYRKYFTSY